MVTDKVIIPGIGWYESYSCLRINGKPHIHVTNIKLTPFLKSTIHLIFSQFLKIKKRHISYIKFISKNYNNKKSSLNPVSLISPEKR